MRVLLIYPNAKKEIIGWGDRGAIAEPIALEYLAAGAKLDGHEVRLLDLRLHLEELEQAVRDYRPEVVGITGYSMHVLRNLEVCRTVKALQPDCVTVVGGHHATLEPIDFFEPEVDHVVKGEGVGPLRRLLARRAEAGSSPIPGVFSRIDGGFRYGGEPEPFEIDALPPPDRTLVPEDRPRYFIDWMKPIAMLRTTVGCPYRCTFCALWRLMDGRYHKRDLAGVIDELQALPERYVFFVDDEPFLDADRMWALGRAIQAAGIQKEFFAYSRIDSVLRHPELMEFWHQLGLRRLLFGIESIFDRELSDYNKRQKRDEIVQGLQAARRIGISLFCNFIVSPLYTQREFDELVQFIRDNEVDYPSFTILTPIPGTGDSYDGVLERQPNGRPNWDYFDLQHAVTATAMPKADFARAFDNLYQVFSLNYLRSESPLTVESYQEHDSALSDAYISIARRVLGGR